MELIIDGLSLNSKEDRERLLKNNIPVSIPEEESGCEYSPYINFSKTNLYNPYIFEEYYSFEDMVQEISSFEDKNNQIISDIYVPYYKHQVKEISLLCDFYKGDKNIVINTNKNKLICSILYMYNEINIGNYNVRLGLDFDGMDIFNDEYIAGQIPEIYSCQYYLNIGIKLNILDCINKINLANYYNVKYFFLCISTYRSEYDVEQIIKFYNSFKEKIYVCN